MIKRVGKIDGSVPIGFGIAGACLVIGVLLENGAVDDLLQITAAMIVFGGTISAVVISTPKRILRSVLQAAASNLSCDPPSDRTVLDDIVRLAFIQRGDSKLLEAGLEKSADPFLHRAIHLVADGFSSHDIRYMLELELHATERKTEEYARVFEAAAGYAPTMGVVGAVLGLMVMKHIDEIQGVGHGIAVAFVATLYGVGAANLVLLPIAHKLRAQARVVAHVCEIVIEGAVAIRDGKSPRLIREMLEPFIGDFERKVLLEQPTATEQSVAPVMS